MRFEPTTKAYAARRTAEGKTPREIKRCLKRAIAREVYRIMQTDAASITTIETAA
ncbi:transposase IS116/IS110/IS902 family protein [Mycobacterium kansasii 824]|nr:transposase IS116/IS110/IS902 family protein [Mycobacterium kansasii 824]